MYKNNEGKTFIMTNCWIRLNKAKNWMDLIGTLKHPNVASKKLKTNDGD